VTVIHGENGAGKTNLLNALFWCLTGEFTPRLKNPEMLLNRAAYDDDRSSECEVELAFAHEGECYVVLRSSHGRTSRVSVSRITESGADPVHGPEEFLEKLIPRGLSRWFFYDAEAIGELELSGSAQFKQSLRRILGFELVDMLLDDLDKCLGAKQRQQARLVKSTELQQLQEQIANIEHVLPGQRKKAAELEEAAAKQDQQVAELEHLLRKMPQSRPLQDERARLDKMRAQRVEEIKEGRAQMARCVGDAAPAALIASRAATFGEHLHIRENTGRLPAPFSDQLVEDILADGVCVCGRCVSAGSDEETKIRSLLKTAATADFNARVRNIQYLLKDIQGLTESFRPTLKETGARIEKASRELEEIDERRKRIREQLEAIDEDVIRDAESKRTSAAAKARDFHQQCAVTKNRIEENEEEIERLRRRYEAMSKQQGADKVLGQEIDKIKRLSEYIRRTMTRQEDQALKILQIDLNQVLDRFLTKHYKARINGKSYRVELLDDKDRLVGDSTGEGQVLKFAFITTVVALAAKKTFAKVDFLAEPTQAPLVLDAPFSALDSEYQGSVAGNLASRTNQLVLLLSSAGWSDRVSGALDPFVGKRYALISRQSGPRGNKPVKEMLLGGKRIRLNEYGSDRDETVIRELL
jgi:DNA sulfur modification protein DndD